MTIPKSVARYGVREYLAKVLADADPETVLTELERPIPPAGSKDYQEWSDAIGYVKDRL